MMPVVEGGDRTEIEELAQRIRERDTQVKRAALQQKVETHVRREADRVNEVEDFELAFADIGTLSLELLREKPDQAELIEVGPPDPVRPTGFWARLMQPAVKVQREEIPAWELASGRAGPYSRHHDLPACDRDHIRIMVCADGRVVYGVTRRVFDERGTAPFEKPGRYEVVASSTQSVPGRSATIFEACKMNTAEDIRRRIAQMRA